MIKKIFKNIRNTIYKSEFNRDLLTLMTGTTVAQAIPIAITPILTRLYTPEDFGVFALFLAISTILASIVNGRYELAILLPNEDEEAINVAALGILIAISVAIILLIVVIFFSSRLGSLLGNTEIIFWLYLVPIIVVASGVFNVLKYLNIRKKLYKVIAITNIKKSITLASIQLFVGLIKSGAAGLIIGRIISQFVANIELLKNAKFKYDLKKIKKRRIIQSARKYKKFPKYSLWAGLANVSSNELVNILISFVYSVKTLGFYFLPIKVLAMPSALISQAVGDIFFQKATQEKNETGFVKKTFPIFLKKLFFISAIIFLILFFIIEDLFVLIFGSDWEISGTYAKILIPLFFIRFIVSPLTSMNIIFNRNEVGMIWQFLLLFIQITILIFAFYLELNIEEYLKIMVIFLIIHYLVLLKIISNYNE